MRSRSRASMNRIRQFAEEFIMQNRRSPSCNEIAEALSMAKSTVYRYLVAMDEEGMIEYDHKSITTEKTQKTRFATANVPLVGSVSCGAPLLEEEYIQCYVSLPTELFGNGDYSGPPAHLGRSSAQLDRASAHLMQSAVQPMLAAVQHTS